MSEPGRKEISARDEHKALAAMLKERYEHQEGGKETAQKVCALCGEHRPQVYELSKDLVICKKCRDSGVSSMSEAAGLLYLAYGNFRRRFPSALFRYPDLLISQQSMYDIISANPIVTNIHRDVENTDFLKIRNSESDKFTIEIVKDPYFSWRNCMFGFLPGHLEKAKIIKSRKTGFQKRHGFHGRRNT